MKSSWHFRWPMYMCVCWVMSDSLQPHGLWPARLLCPWDFPGKKEYWSGLPFPSPVHESEKWKWSLSVVSNSSRLHGLQPTRLLHPWDFPGKSTGVGCHCLLQLHNEVNTYFCPSFCLSSLFTMRWTSSEGKNEGRAEHAGMRLFLNKNFEMTRY